MSQVKQKWKSKQLLAVPDYELWTFCKFSSRANRDKVVKKLQEHTKMEQCKFGKKQCFIKEIELQPAISVSELQTFPISHDYWQRHSCFDGRTRVKFELVALLSLQSSAWYRVLRIERDSRGGDVTHDTFKWSSAIVDNRSYFSVWHCWRYKSLP